MKSRKELWDFEGGVDGRFGFVGLTILSFLDDLPHSFEPKVGTFRFSKATN